jgi:outer membrane protein assembly factor BamD (BamD/ComL family)
MSKIISKSIFVILCCILLIGCAATKQYKESVKTNTISVYENYLQKFPKSKYKSDVEQRLYVLRDNTAYSDAVRKNTISSYEEYIRNFPNGNEINIKLAKQKLETLKREKAEADNWILTKNKDQIESYEAFIKSYPNSKRNYEAQTRIVELKDLKSWQIAQDQNTIESYTAYINAYPIGKYTTIAKSKIEQIEEEKYILPEWNKAKVKNTYKAYNDFYHQYSNSSYASLALEKMKEIEDKDWEKAKHTNTIASYKKYIANYPDGNHKEAAEEKIIDCEVAAIMSGNHSVMPSLDRTSYGYGDYSTVEIENSTAYTLTILYSGPSSKKLVIPSHKTYSITLTNGNYKVAAKVNASNVTPFAGNERLQGGEYSGYYYIETRTYRY